MKPLQTQGSVRDYADATHPHPGTDQWGPSHTASFGIAPSGPQGAHCREYSQQSDHRMAPAFIVDQSNDHSWWEFANETNGNQVALTVRICRDNARRDVIKTFEGRSTTTGTPFGHFKDLPKGIPLFIDVEVSEVQPAGVVVPPIVKVPLWLQAAT